MSVEFHCLECLTSYEVEDELAGKTIRCRDCYTPGKVVVPAKKTDKKTRPKLILDSDCSEPPAVEADRNRTVPSPETRGQRVICYRCPFCHSERLPRRPIFTGIVATAMLAIGVLSAVNYWFFFTFSVSSSSGLLVNDGLMNERIVGMIGTVGLCLGGTLIRVTAANRRYCRDCRICLD